MLNNYVAQNMSGLKRRLVNKYKVPANDVEVVAFNILTRAAEWHDEDKGTFSTAVYAVTHSVVCNYYNSREQYMESYNDNLMLENPNEPERVSHFKGVLDDVIHHISSLPNKQHSVIAMRIMVEEETIDDVANDMGLSVDMVRKTVYRIRRNMREIFKEDLRW